jgi:hypothetical protein
MASESPWAISGVKSHYNLSWLAAGHGGWGGWLEMEKHGWEDVIEDDSSDDYLMKQENTATSA